MTQSRLSAALVQEASARGTGYVKPMTRLLLPAEASQQAVKALAAAGLTGLDVRSERHGTAIVTTTVRVSVGDANRVLAVLRTLPYLASSGRAGWRGGFYEVSIDRRVGMAGPDPRY